MHGRRSPRRPGNGFAEAQKGERENKQCDNEQSQDFAAFAREESLIQLTIAFLRAKWVRAVHRTILREG